MQRKNEISKILKDKTGASLIFVLGIMLLIMAIGVSALVAASANTGFMLRQKEHNQILILDDAIHKNIMYSLQRDTASDGLLSRQLVMAIYDARDPDPPVSAPLAIFPDISLTISFDNGLEAESNHIKVKSITLSFPETLAEMVNITDPIPAVYTPAVYDEEGLLVSESVLDKPREPKMATVNATMNVIVEISADGTIITSGAVYKYTGGVLSDDPDGVHFDDDSDAEFEMILVPDGDGKCGGWEMKKHEKVDR